jgi:hypothetical protein
MNALVKDWLRAFSHVLADHGRRSLLLMGIVGLAAFVDFSVLGLARRTFVFYAIDDGIIVVEDRMLKRSPSREVTITRYVEEALLGPVSPECLPLFPRGTRLRSLLYRDGVVYADFSEDAALPPEETGEVLGNFRILYEGLRRNFSFIQDARFFIAGKAAYYDEFRQPGKR